MVQIGTDVAVRQPGLPIEVTPESIAKVQRTLALLRESIPGILIPNVDFGHIPGVKGMSLFDSGAQSIINFFTAYAGQRNVLHFRDDGQMVAICVEVQIIDRRSGFVIATGVGASSTEESKNKYRWVENPLDWGYSQEALANWPKKDIKPNKESGVLEYKIKNPEHAEPDYGTLFKVCFELWGLQPAEVARELGYGSQKDISGVPWDCYITIKRIKEG
jgi:hypothetical protein